MNEQNPFAAIPTNDAAARDAATPTAQDARSPQERRARGESEVLAAGLPAWNLEPPTAPVRRRRA